MKIIYNGKLTKIDNLIDLLNQKKSLLEILLSQGFFIRSYCAGKGKCGKCGVNLVYKNGTVEKLSCLVKNIETKDLEYIEIPNAAEAAPSRFYTQSTKVIIPDTVRLGIAVDIGTTNIEVILADTETLLVYGKVSVANSQRIYGADVISRIEAAENNAAVLSGLVKEDILLCIQKLLSGTGAFGNVDKIVLTGNTAMLGILLKKDMRLLKAYPFDIDSTLKKPQVFSFIDIFQSNLLRDEVEIYIPPCISAFIGADVYTGAHSINTNNKNYLYLDIGTNCEILLNDGKIYASSAAAGPALESVGISCGIESVGAAIKSVSYDPYKKFTVKTISGEKPAGLCGSGVIDAAAVLLLYGFMNSEGLLKDDYFKNGIEIAEGVFLNQNDIRNIQLAKSAIYTCVDYVVKNSGAGYKNIENVYIAGSFSSGINIKNIFAISLLPKDLNGKITLVGNSALNGAVKMLNKDFKNFIIGENTLAGSIEIMPSLSEDFQERFIKNLNFKLT